MTFEFRLLGPLEARRDGIPVALGTRKQRALLAHLLARANDPVPIARLIDELWPDGPPATAEHAIHVYVSGLRKALGDPGRIARDERAYVLATREGELDLERFRALVAEARAALEVDSAASAERLAQASALWRGRALADLDGEIGVRDLLLGLEEERLDANELRIEAELALGRHGHLVAELERLIAEQPAREAFYRQLMLALYRAGRQADALDVFGRARTNLRRELGLEPSPRLRDLQGAILRQDPSLAVDTPELRARRHLPPGNGATDGREQEVAELSELLASGGVRLVTLTGVPGAGRTDAAVAAAGRAAGSFRDGVWYVDLGSAGDAATLGHAVARALELEGPAGLPGQLRSKELLLVLDRFDDLRSAAAELSELLRRAPRLKVLAVGGSRLRLYGEHEYELAP